MTFQRKLQEIFVSLLFGHNQQRNVICLNLWLSMLFFILTKSLKYNNLHCFLSHSVLLAKILTNQLITDKGKRMRPSMITPLRKIAWLSSYCSFDTVKNRLYFCWRMYKDVYAPSILLQDIFLAFSSLRVAIPLAVNSIIILWPWRMLLSYCYPVTC